jgi:hypothetical protein
VQTGGDEELKYGPMWHSFNDTLNLVGVGQKFSSNEAVAFVFRSDLTTLFPPRSSGELSRHTYAPSPTLLALLADLPLSGCWAAVVDRIIEEYPETEPYIRPVLEAYDAGTLTQAAGA